MYYFEYILKKVNDSMRSKKTKEKMEKNESYSLSESCPLLMLVLWVVVIVCAMNILPYVLEAFLAGDKTMSIDNLFN